MTPIDLKRKYAGTHIVHLLSADTSDATLTPQTTQHTATRSYLEQENRLANAGFAPLGNTQQHLKSHS